MSRCSMKMRNNGFFLLILVLVSLSFLKASPRVSRLKKIHASRARQTIKAVDKSFDSWNSLTENSDKININSREKNKITNGTIHKTIHKTIDNKPEVYVYQLENGLTVLVRVVKTVPNVSMQLWYGVGSKHEQDGERGSAHLLEHMLFKGTHIRSESDISTEAHKMSAVTNAFTSYDFTGYIFDFPVQNWRHGLAIFADCMENCTFKEDHLSSEMKAVIQELKMYKDSYQRTLVEELVGLIFQDHPYHHPIVGYKQDLWNVKSSDLFAFYKKHYKPNNATLIVVGDVDPDDVFQEAKKAFGHIKPDWSHKKEEFYFNQDIAAKSVQIYRDVKQPRVCFAFVVPGLSAKKDHLLSLIDVVLGQGKSSRLYKKIVDELQLATSLRSSSYDLFDHGLFLIAVEPKSVETIETISSIIKKELAEVAETGITDEELITAIKQNKMAIYGLLESNKSQAERIGASFLATGDPEYIYNYFNYPLAELKEGVHQLIKDYLRPAVMHTGLILPLPASEKEQWIKLQKRSDEEDKRILFGRVRNTPVEPPVNADKVEVGKRVEFAFPKPEKALLSNGLTLYYYNNPQTPKLELVLSFAARSYYDSDKLPGLYNFVTSMMTEGTKNYTAQELAHAVESRGMDISVSPGRITMSFLSEDLLFALDILEELLTNATFDTKEIEKVRDQLNAKIKRVWDDPGFICSQLVREDVYKGHPYSKNLLGTYESIGKITQKDLIDFYTKYISLQGARLAIVGDLSGYNIVEELENSLGKCKGCFVEPIQFPVVKYEKVHEINYPINRDQVMLFLGALSIDRKHADYDKLMLFDQIFGGGVLGSMSSRLFDLREETGLFYTIGGSLIAGADEQPGMLMVKTIVSLDRLQEAEKAIRNTMLTTVDTVTEEEFEQAKQAVINSLVNNFTSSARMAELFLFLDKYRLPIDFFDKRAVQLEAITLDEVKEAASKILNQKSLLTVRVGRVDKIVADEENGNSKE